MLITYASRTLNKHEINKPVIEKELLAIAWGIEFFRPNLFARKFIVVTDHGPLVSLFTHKNSYSKVTRVRLELCDYVFEIIYKKGSINTNADALSRIKIDSDMLKQKPKMIITKLTRRIYLEKILTRIYGNIHHCKKYKMSKFKLDAGINTHNKQVSTTIGLT